MVCYTEIQAARLEALMQQLKLLSQKLSLQVCCTIMRSISITRTKIPTHSHTNVMHSPTNYSNCTLSYMPTHVHFQITGVHTNAYAYTLHILMDILIV